MCGEKEIVMSKHNSTKNQSQSGSAQDKNNSDAKNKKDEQACD